MYRVEVMRSGTLKLRASASQNLLELLRKAGVPVASSCDGEGICRKCGLQVRPLKVGPTQKSTRVRTSEGTTSTDQSLRVKMVLSCQYEIQEDIEVSASYW